MLSKHGHLAAWSPHALHFSYFVLTAGLLEAGGLSGVREWQTPWLACQPDCPISISAINGIKPSYYLVSSQG